jgi:nitronate monooxygenase
MLRGRKRKHWMRTLYTLNSLRRLRNSLSSPDTNSDYWQAGRSVAGIHSILPAAQIVQSFRIAAA